MLRWSHPIPGRKRSCWQRFRRLAQRPQAEEERWGSICLVQKLLQGHCTACSLPGVHTPPCMLLAGSLPFLGKALWDIGCWGRGQGLLLPCARAWWCIPLFPFRVGISIHYLRRDVKPQLCSWPPVMLYEPRYGEALPKRLMQPGAVLHMWQPVGTQGCSQGGEALERPPPASHPVWAVCPQPLLCLPNSTSGLGSFPQEQPLLPTKLAELCSWGTDSRRSWVSERQCVSYHRSRARRLSRMRNGHFQDQERVAPAVKGFNSPSVI